MAHERQGPYALPRARASEGVFTIVGDTPKVGFAQTGGLLVLPRKNLTVLATTMRSLGYKDLMLISDGKEQVQFIAGKPDTPVNDTNLYMRQRYRDEHDPQNGKSVFIALDLTRSIDELYFEAGAWQRDHANFISGEPLPDDQVTIAELSERPIVLQSYLPNTGELLPDTPAVTRHTFSEILRDERGLGAVVMSGLKTGRMLQMTYPPV